MKSLVLSAVLLTLLGACATSNDAITDGGSQLRDSPNSNPRVRHS